MRLFEFEKERISNPLNNGEVSTEAYHAMDLINDIEGDLSEELRYIHPNMPRRQFYSVLRTTIRDLGKVINIPISKLIPFEPDYDPVHIQQGLKTEPADVYSLYGKYYVNDGNHRVIAAHLSGAKTVKVTLVDTNDVVKKTDELYLKRKRETIE